MNTYNNNYIDNYINNYTDKFYGNYLKKKIYIDIINNGIILCEFLNHKSYIHVNHEKIKMLLLRKPKKIKIKFDNQNFILKDTEYNYVYSKDLIDTFNDIVDINHLPFEIESLIKSYVPEYGKLF